MKSVNNAANCLQGRFRQILLIMIIGYTPGILSCNGNNFSGTAKKEEPPQPKALLSERTKEKTCNLESLDWACNDDESSCSTKLLTPDKSEWNCKWSKKKYSCTTSDLNTKPETCNDSQWKCREASPASWACSLSTVPNPDNEDRPSDDWACSINSQKEKILCKKSGDFDDPVAEEDPAEADPEAKETGNSTSTKISTSTNADTTGCKDFNLAGNWSGPWKATTLMGGSGTYSLTFTQTPDGKLSGPFKITGTPCAGADSGKITGSFNSDCSIEFMTDVGGGSIGSDQRGFCKFAWKGKIDPSTKTGEGTWTAGPDIAGTWQTKKE